MVDSHPSAVMFETVSGLLPQIGAAEVESRPAVSNLNQILRGLSPLPPSALFLGLADDGLPVLLNLDDPVPGPVLVSGDHGSGKTRLLQVIARAVGEGHDPDRIRCAILTAKPDEWGSFDQSPHCEGILSFQQPLTTNYLNSLVDWAHTNKNSGQYVLLLVDDLEALNADADLHQAFRWLLLRGPSRRIWPIVTLDPAHLSAVTASWLSSFRTRLCGHMVSGRDLLALTGSTDFAFQNLISGSQFAMREGANWLPFRLPRLD